MYGTTMIGTLATGVGLDDVKKELDAWESERDVPGYVSSHVMLGDDGKTIVNVAMFESKDAYVKLADDPDQDEWYREHFAPMLDGDPQWIDGSWIS